MCTSRLRARVSSAEVVCVARLARHALRFHKKSIDGSSKADALETNSGTDEVLGVVFEIDPAQKRLLDAAEGINGADLRNSEI